MGSWGGPMGGDARMPPARDRSTPQRRSAIPHTPGRERHEEAVCEAVLRYQLQQPLVDHPHVPHYYLALQGHDPDAALLRRLRALTPWVQPLSQCRVTARDGVLDRTT